MASDKQLKARKRNFSIMRIRGVKATVMNIAALFPITLENAAIVTRVCDTIEKLIKGGIHAPSKSEAEDIRC